MKGHCSKEYNHKTAGRIRDVHYIAVLTQERERERERERIVVSYKNQRVFTVEWRTEK